MDFNLLRVASKKQHDFDLLFANCAKGDAGEFSRPVAELKKVLLKAVPGSTPSEIDDFLKNSKVFSKKDTIHLFEWRISLPFFSGVDEAVADSPLAKRFYNWSAEDHQKLKNMWSRVKEITEAVRTANGCLLLDAEQSYFFSAISLIAEQLQLIYNLNSGHLIVFNTI